MLRTVGPKIEAKVSKIKWEQKRIEKANHRCAARGVRESLGFIATRAKTKELRRKKGPSEAGKPPHVHTRKALSVIRYEYDYHALTGVVGPVIQHRSDGKAKNQSTVPATLEYGGSYSIKEHWQQFGNSKTEGRWVRTTRANSRSGKKLRHRTRRITIKPRPFIRPALKFEMQAGNLNEAFKDSWS